MGAYALVLLDIDGTLVDSKDQVSPNTKKLLSRLERRGIPVILCSARSPSGVESVEQLVGLHSPIVCYGGGLILDAERAIIEDIGIAGETALQFKQYADHAFPDVAINTYLYDVWLVDSVDDPRVQILMQKNQCEAIAGSLPSALRTASHVHKLLCAGTPSDILRLQSDAAGRFPTLQFARSGSIYLEVLPKDVSKDTAMERLRTYYNVNTKEIVALGDYFVDMEMLRHAGLGIAMGNAPEEVKAAAARVTGSNDEEGVYIALKNLKFHPPGVAI